MDFNEIAIENFRTYLKIKTVQPNPDYNGAILFLTNIAQDLNLPYQIFEVTEKKPIFLITILGDEPNLPSILLNSHLDVVPVFEKYWKYDPFAAHIDEKGDIYARGSQDMKSVGIQYIEAIRRLLYDGKKFKRTVYLTFVPDEEIGGADGMAKYVKTDNFKSLNLGFALDEGIPSESEIFNIYYAERNPWWIEVICPGDPGHGSMFIQNNAANKLRNVINSFLTFRDSEEQRMKENNLTIGEMTTVNLTMIESQVRLHLEYCVQVRNPCA